jgi:hypothetical protein
MAQAQVNAEIIEHLFANLPAGAHDADEINLKKNAPTWSDAKAKLAGFDRAGLIGLVQDLYADSNDNRAFLHARVELGADDPKPCRATIDCGQWTHVLENQDSSIGKAMRVIANRKKTVGQPEGVAKGPRP